MSKRIREIDLDLIESPKQEPDVNFGLPEDYVELHVYDPNDNYLTSTIVNDYKVEDQVKLKPGNDLRDLGFTEGKFKVIYNFFRRKGGSDNTVLLNSDSKVHKDKFYMTDNNKVYVGEPPVKGQGIDQPVELFVEDEKYWIQEILHLVLHIILKLVEPVPWVTIFLFPLQLVINLPGLMDQSRI